MQWVRGGAGKEHLHFLGATVLDNHHHWSLIGETRCCFLFWLNSWGWVTHKCVGSDNGLSPGWRQAIIWTNAGILLIGPLGTNFSEILIQIFNIFIKENAFESVVCEMSAILSRPQCVNTLWPSDIIRRQGNESTLAQVMACCLTAPSHYLNQCWLIISKVLWHSSEDIIIRRFEYTNQ